MKMLLAARVSLNATLLLFAHGLANPPLLLTLCRNSGQNANER
jgi:hypothetical protein